MRALFLSLFTGIALSFAATAPTAAKEAVYQSFIGGVAINGYDPVAYFDNGAPVEGSSEFEFEWNDATWRFASAENRDRFAADPAAFAPQYGGYCAWAVSQGYTASTDPEAWKIVDGKLYLNYSKGVQKQWEENQAGNISKADANWPAVLD